MSTLGGGLRSKERARSQDLTRFPFAIGLSDKRPMMFQCHMAPYRNKISVYKQELYSNFQNFEVYQTEQLVVSCVIFFPM